MIFEWKEEYSVGVGKMDDHHKRIIVLINELAEGLKNNEGVIRKFQDLGKFVIVHFDEEEKLMEEKNYEGLKTHKIIHQNLLKKLSFFEAEVANNRVDEEELMTFLKMWLTSHIMGIDKKYSEAFGVLPPKKT